MNGSMNRGVENDFLHVHLKTGLIKPDAVTSKYPCGNCLWQFQQKPRVDSG